MPKQRLVKNIDGGGDADILTSVVSLDIVDSLGERKRLAIAATQHEYSTHNKFFFWWEISVKILYSAFEKISEIYWP